MLGNGASGTWAGVYYPFAFPEQPDDDALAEFLTIFGPSAAHADNPMPAEQPAKPTRYGRYWLHPAQLRLELKEAN